MLTMEILEKYRKHWENAPREFTSFVATGREIKAMGNITNTAHLDDDLSYRVSGVYGEINNPQQETNNG